MKRKASQLRKSYELKTLYAECEMIEFHDRVMELTKGERDLTQQELMTHFDGDFLPAQINGLLLETYHRWSVDITADLRHKDGSVVREVYGYDLPLPMKFNQVFGDKYNDGLVMNGEKWQGIVDFFLKDIDKDYGGDYLCERAVCCLTTKTYAKKDSPAMKLINSLHQHLVKVK